jgi:exodeoxyribonuclease VII large subunit
LNQPAPRPQSGGNAAEYSVSELSGAIKRALEEGFGYVRLRGEISGFRGAHASGHCYFGLKDDKAKIDAVIWKMTYGRLKVKPEEGMEVIVQGRVTSYPGSSKYQIVIESLEPAGLGALMALLEERKRKFTAEGLFAEERKKARPYLPQLVGIITSPTGAVIRDMLHGFAERFPTRVIVWPVRVQGDTCAAEVAAAINGFNAILPGGRIARPDVLIVARGGGSLEDLWGFNEEIVVRAVAASGIPIISAVGHETDWTLIDLVADARAPTPTKAAEWAVPKFAELAENTSKCGSRLTTAARRMLQQSRAHLKAATRGLPRLEDVLALPRQRFDACEKRLGRALLANARAHHTRYARVSARLRPTPIMQRIAVCGERAGVLQARAAQALRNGLVARRRQLEGYDKLLGTLSYQSVLQRGFALVRDADGRAVRSASAVQPGDRLDLEFGDGRVEAEALNVSGGDPKRAAPATVKGATPPPPAGVRRTRGRGGSSQGSLF